MLDIILSALEKCFTDIETQLDKIDFSSTVNLQQRLELEQRHTVYYTLWTEIRTQRNNH